MKDEYEEDEFFKMALDALDRARKRAFEIAVRTGTALVYEKNSKIVEYKPPYRYELVPIKATKKKRVSQTRQKKKPS